MTTSKWKRALPLLLIAIVMALLLPELAWACPTCKDAVAQNDPTHSGMVKGYFVSILFMMSMPFLILGGLVTYFYLLVRKARAQDNSPAINAASLISHSP